LNLVTKRGTNELKGSARALRGKAGWDYGLEAGGPLWKDRVWLWGAAARTDFLGHTLTLVTGETVHQKPKLDQLNAKLDAQITPSNSLTLFYLHADKSFQGLSYFLSSQEATWDQTTPTQADRVEDSYVLSQRLFASLYFSYLNEAITLTPEGGRDKQAAIDADGIYRNSILFARVRRPQHQAGATLSAFFDTGTIAHELKFGFGYRHTIANSFSSWPGDKIIADELDGIALLTRDENIKYEMNYYDAYVQDTIQAGNLTLNAGTRFDYQQGRNLPSSVAANPVFPDLLPAVHYAGNTGYPITWRLTQPRIGATYALGKEKKTLVRASYSEFADQLGSEVFEINAFPGYQYLYYYWNDVNNDHHVEKSEVDLASGLLGYYGLDPNNPAAATSVNRIARNLEPPRTTELIFGVEREISPDFSASLAYTHRSLRNPEFGVPIGTSRGDYQYLGNAAGAITDAEGFTLSFDEPYYGLTAYPPPAGVEIRNRPDYRETYDGIEIQLVKRFSRGWMLRGSFAYNDWRKRVGVGAIVDPNNKVGGTNASGAVVEPVFASSRASIFINSKWQFNLSGLAELPFHIVAGANFFGRQGFALPYYVKVATHDTAGSRPNIQIGAVDDYRLPDVFEIDLHLERPFRIGQKLTVRASLDCFNAANSHTVLLRDENVGTWNTAKSPAFSPSPGFNQATETLEGRVFRGGVRISF
jgi:hypothetical protein